MELVIGNKAWSSWSMRPWLVLKRADAEFTETLVELRQGARTEAAIAPHSPSGHVPALKDDGVWLIKDIRAKQRWQDNLRNPLLAMMYGTSVATCMSSALSEPGGAGLGTLGFPTELAERMVRDAGFTRFVVHDFDDPANLYYEVRP